MSTEKNIEEILEIVRSERTVNNARFGQLTSKIESLEEKMDDGFRVVHEEIKGIKLNINALSEDIQVFAEDLNKLTRRVDRIEKKIA